MAAYAPAAQRSGTALTKEATMPWFNGTLVVMLLVAAVYALMQWRRERHERLLSPQRHDGPIIRHGGKCRWPPMTGD